MTITPPTKKNVILHIHLHVILLMFEILYCKLSKLNFHNTIGQGELTNEDGSCYCNKVIIINSCLIGKKCTCGLESNST